MISSDDNSAGENGETKKTPIDMPASDVEATQHMLNDKNGTNGAVKSENQPAKRVCIIGAGTSGLPTMRWALEEGFDVVCYERTSDMGGLWNYRTDLPEGYSTVMKSTVINTSKEMMTFSDFVPDAKLPNYMHNRHVLHWLRQYAEQHKLLERIHYDTTVISVKRTADYEQTGAWLVRTDAASTAERFDAVFLCVGHHAIPYKPQLPGMDTFRGPVVHSQSYRDNAPYKDKRVLVVGIGNSALDASVELAQVTEQVYLSTRRGAWIFQRVGKHGRPTDSGLFTRMKTMMIKIPGTDEYLRKQMNKRFDHELYGVKPKHSFLAQHITLNDALPNAMITGAVIVKGDVKRFTETGVIFEDDTEAELDAVILCTGYQFTYPFFDEPAPIAVKDNAVDLYKWVYPPDLPHPTLAVIGLIQPYGSISPIAEMQARWAMKLLAGQAHLPSAKDMWHDLAEKRTEMAKRYVASPRHTVQVDYMSYMDELSELIGCRPNMLKYFFKDHKLWRRMFFGPNVPYVYRLDGPNSWDGARQAIMDVETRMKMPLHNRDTKCKNSRCSVPPLMVIQTLITIGLTVALYFALSASLSDGCIAGFIISLLLYIFFLIGNILYIDMWFDLSGCLM